MKRVPLYLALFLLVGCGEDTELTTDTGTATPTEIAPAATGVFSLNAAKTALTFEITATNLSGEIIAAHIHNAAAGSTGIAVKTLAFTNNTASGIWKSTDFEPLTSALVTELEADRLYANIHTEKHSAGEIREQIIPIPTGSKGFTAKITGSQQVPPVLTAATGTGAFSLNTAETELTYEITVTNIAGDVTGGIYKAAVGVNTTFPVLVLSFTNNTASGIWKTDTSTVLTPDLVTALKEGRLYVNILTEAKQEGEIRGQITPVASDSKGFISKTIITH